MTYTQDDFIKELAKDFTEDKEKPLKKRDLLPFLINMAKAEKILIKTPI